VADLIGPMPIVTLFGGATIAFEAVDPTTGANVSGVEVSAALVSAEDLTVTPESTETPSVANTAVFLPGPAFE
jgi:hypothetical protein